jgi:transposase
MDIALGRSLAGYAGALSAEPDLPSTLAGVGALGRVQEDCRDIGRRPAKSGQTRLGRVLHRRDLRSGEKGGAAVGKTKRGKGTKLMAVADGAGSPVAIHAASASPHEVTLAQDTVEQRFTADLPQRLIGDLAYDSDPLDAQFAKQGIELIAPHRENRSRPATQDGRALRRYRRRWKVERLFAWLQNFRRLVVRYEYHVENFLGFVHLGCMLILLRRYF